MGMRHVVVDTSMGEVTIVADGPVVTGLYFAEHARRPAAESFGARVEVAGDELLSCVSAQLVDYLAGRLRVFDVPVSAAGDAFQRSVWALVAQVGYGQTTTYGAIAEQLGDKALAQRVGQAVGANPVCVFIPCHRVVGADGSLTGYAGGLERKRTLLDLEEPAALAARLF